MLIFLLVLVSCGLQVHSCVEFSHRDAWLCSVSWAELRYTAQLWWLWSFRASSRQRWLHSAQSTMHTLRLVFSFTVSGWAAMAVTDAVAGRLKANVSAGAAFVDFLGEFCKSGLLSAAGLFWILQLQQPLCWLETQ